MIRLICSLLLICPFAVRAAEPVIAFVRFSDSTQRYKDTPYLFLGDGAIELRIEVKPAAGHTLQLLWGAKNDERSAVLEIAGRQVPLKSGGYDGFQWLATPLPQVAGDNYVLTLRPGADKVAFLAEIRLTGQDNVSVDLKAASAKMTYKVLGKEPAKPVEAFPEMRAMWDREPAIKTPLVNRAMESGFREAERNARQAAEGLYRCRRFVDGWLAHAEPKTGLIPRNLNRDKDLWNGRDAGADNYPFMVLTCALTDRAMFEGRMLEMLRTEEKLTKRHDRLPDDVILSTQQFARKEFNLDATIFDGTEYVKDGLLPLTEWLGPSPWSQRMIGIIDDVWKNANIDTPFGKIPTPNYEVNGDLLQACSRLYWFTGDRKYLDWAIRLGDYYLLGDKHPTRDLEKLALSDHACEAINGLSELYLAVSYAEPKKRDQYRKPLQEMYDRILEIGVNEHGLMWGSVNTKTGQHNNSLTDNWGYNYDGIYTAWLVDKKPAYRDAVLKVLGNLKPHYTGQVWQGGSADGYADSIEGAINLFNREPVEGAAAWIDSEIRTMWSKQKSDGVIEGWHGDGNSARTSIMYVLWKSQGARVEPWRPDVRIGAVRRGSQLLISLSADQDWKGRLIFDKPRHKLHMKLPMDYPRINQFPEWFTVDAAREYTLRHAADGGERKVTGEGLIDGIAVEIKGGEELRWAVERP